MKAIAPTKLHHVVDLRLHLTKLFDLEMTLEPADPRLGGLPLILVDGQVLGHVCFNLLSLLRLLPIQAEGVCESRTGEIVIDCQMVHTESKKALDQGTGRSN